MLFGDLIVNVANQVQPYEVNAGETERMTAEVAEAGRVYEQGEVMSRAQTGDLPEIIEEFAAIPCGRGQECAWASWARST